MRAALDIAQDAGLDLDAIGSGFAQQERRSQLDRGSWCDSEDNEDSEGTELCGRAPTRSRPLSASTSAIRPLPSELCAFVPHIVDMYGIMPYTIPQERWLWQLHCYERNAWTRA